VNVDRPLLSIVNSREHETTYPVPVLLSKFLLSFLFIFLQFGIVAATSRVHTSSSATQDVFTLAKVYQQFMFTQTHKHTTT